MKKLTACLVVALALWAGEARTGEVKGEWTVELLSGPSFINSQTQTKGEPTVKKQDDSTRVGNTTGIRGRFFFPLRTTKEDLLGDLQFGVGTEILYVAMLGNPSLVGPGLTPIQFLFRYPFTQKFRPHLSVGPLLFRAKSLRNEFATSSKTTHAISLNLGAGTEIPLSEKISFLVEYRYFNASFQFDRVGTIITPPVFNPIIGAIVDPADINVSQTVKLRNHSLLLGIVYKF